MKRGVIPKLRDGQLILFLETPSLSIVQSAGTGRIEIFVKTSKMVNIIMDFNLSLRRAIKTGDVKLGCNTVEKIVAEKKAKLVIVAANAPEKVVAMLAKAEDLKVYKFSGSSRQLGKECGRDHMISVLAVLDAGESDILSLAE